MPRIPKTVKIGSRTIRVVCPHHFTEKDIGGQWRPIEDVILIDDQAYGVKKPASHLEQTFFHELVHAVDTIFNNGGKLSDDDVDRLAEGLYQALGPSLRC